MRGTFAGQLEQIRAFGIVQSEGTRNRGQYIVGNAFCQATFYLNVVVNADGGE